MYYKGLLVYRHFCGLDLCYPAGFSRETFLRCRSMKCVIVQNKPTVQIPNPRPYTRRACCETSHACLSSLPTAVCNSADIFLGSCCFEKKLKSKWPLVRQKLTVEVPSEQYTKTSPKLRRERRKRSTEVKRTTFLGFCAEECKKFPNFVERLCESPVNKLFMDTTKFLGWMLRSFVKGKVKIQRSVDQTSYPVATITNSS